MLEHPASAGTAPSSAEHIACVVADPLRFKQKLQIGEDAYALLRARKHLYTMWETAGAATTGAGIAGSSAVAGTFFAPTGLAAWLGLATATTPLGWVVAAAVVAGGGYYGVSRWFAGKGSAFTDTIPKYITTPIDVLGAGLIDLLGSLALRVAAIDGHIALAEIACIRDHFVVDWGFDRSYVDRQLGILGAHADETRIKALFGELSAFLAANPDCNASAMMAELIGFLRELIAADGVIDEREEMAIETIERIWHEQNCLTLAKAGKGLADLSRSAGVVASDAAGVLGRSTRTLGTLLAGAVDEATRTIKAKTGQ